MIKSVLCIVSWVSASRMTCTRDEARVSMCDIAAYTSESITATVDLSGLQRSALIIRPYWQADGAIKSNLALTFTWIGPHHSSREVVADQALRPANKTRGYSICANIFLFDIRSLYKFREGLSHACTCSRSLSHLLVSILIVCISWQSLAGFLDRACLTAGQNVPRHFRAGETAPVNHSDENTASSAA